MLTNEMQIVKAVMLKYAEHYRKRYKANWVPTSENIKETLEKIKPPLDGFAGLTEEDLLTRLDIFFSKNDEWIVTTKHNYHVFITHIHRWIPTQNYKNQPIQAQKPGTYYCDCGNELQLSEICEKCYPHCSNCGEQHATTETCQQYAERTAKMRQIIFNNNRRTGEMKNIKDFI